MKIARRFNAGNEREQKPSPAGTAEKWHGGSIIPDETWSTAAAADPAPKRRAIFCRPPSCGMISHDRRAAEVCLDACPALLSVKGLD